MALGQKEGLVAAGGGLSEGLTVICLGFVAVTVLHERQ